MPIISHKCYHRLMLTGRRYLARLTPAQEVLVEQFAGTARTVWNTGLDQRRAYRQRRAWINYHQQVAELVEAKADPDLTWLADVPGHCLQQTLMDLDKACRTHGTFRVHWRAKHRWSPSFRFPEGRHMRPVRLSAHVGQVNLPKLGQVRFRWSRPLGGQVRSATLTRDGVHGGWYLSFLVEDGLPDLTPGVEDVPAPDVSAVGVDRGVVVALACSDGAMLDRVFTTPAEQASIAALQARAARQHGPRAPGARTRRAPSSRWLRTQATITSKLARQRRRRDDFTAKAAHDLARDHGLVAVEKLRVAQMTTKAAPKPDPARPGAFLPNGARSKSGLNRAILDKGWGKFLLALHHQARYTGTFVVTVPAAYTSQRCHQCSHTHTDNRNSQAEFRCTRCGWHDNADTNAALNIMTAGLAAAGCVRPS